MKLTVYTSRTEIKATGRSTEFNVSKTNEKLSFFKLNEYAGSGLNMFGFENGLVDNDRDPNDENQVTILANMLIPAYFKNVGETNDNKDIHGLFLAQIGALSMAQGFAEDLLSLGRFGCPKRLIISPERSSDHFKFNGMRFYPFVMTDFAVGYYICDEGTPSLHWPAYTPQERGVAIDYPVMYDATLGLFMTRSSHIEN